MAVKLDRGSSPLALSMTPLIDIVFNLLIFSLVASEFAEEERELRVILPEASEAQPLTGQTRETFVNIDEAGRYFVTGKNVTLEELESVLKSAWVNNPGKASVIIRADERCRWRYVVAAVNACLKANIRDYRVTTRETEEMGVNSKQ